MKCRMIRIETAEFMHEYFSRKNSSLTVRFGIGAIKRIRHLVPQATLQLIYQALIQPHFDYCNIVWANCGITLRNKVQKLQNGAARVLTYSSYDVDAGHLFKLLGWKNLACQQLSLIHI